LLLPLLWPSLRSLAALRLGVKAVAVDRMLKMNLAATTRAQASTYKNFVARGVLAERI
jgi:hypothetical protein